MLLIVTLLSQPRLRLIDWVLSILLKFFAIASILFLYVRIGFPWAQISFSQLLLKLLRVI